MQLLLHLLLVVIQFLQNLVRSNLLSLNHHSRWFAFRDPLQFLLQEIDIRPRTGTIEGVHMVRVSVVKLFEQNLLFPL
jgi:hypothetical protein